MNLGKWYRDIVCQIYMLTYREIQEDTHISLFYLYIYNKIRTLLRRCGIAPTWAIWLSSWETLRLVLEHIYWSLSLVTLIYVAVPHICCLLLEAKRTNIPSLPSFLHTQESVRCLMRAFVAPLSWMAIMQNGTSLNKEDLTKLLWAAKPFLETMPPSSFVLPAFSQSSHLAEM